MIKEERKISTFHTRISCFSLLVSWFMCQVNFDLKISFTGMISSRDYCLDILISETRINILFHKVFLP